MLLIKGNDLKLSIDIKMIEYRAKFSCNANARSIVNFLFAFGTRVQVQCHIKMNIEIALHHLIRINMTLTASLHLQYLGTNKSLSKYYFLYDITTL